MFKKRLLLLVFLFAFLIASLFIARNPVLNWVFKRTQTQFQEKYHLALTANSVQFTGIRSIQLKELILKPENGNTLLKLQEATVEVSLLNLLRGKLVLKGLKLNGVIVHIFNEPLRNNISFLRGQEKKLSTSETKPINSYRAVASNIQNQLFGILNTAFEVKNCRLIYQDTARDERLYIPSFSFDKKQLAGLVINEQNGDSLSISGTVIKNAEEYSFSIKQIGSDTTYLPFSNKGRGLKCRFKSMDATVSFEQKSDALKVNTTARITNFHLNHWRLANSDVVFADTKFNSSLAFMDGAIVLDSSSVFTLNNVPCKLFASCQIQPDTALAFHLHIPETVADTFVQALPSGMFNTLKGISCTGTFGFDLAFAIHTNNPDSLQFVCSLKQKNLRIQHYGAENYGRINQEFTYEAYDKNRFVRTILIGSANPFYTPFSAIPSACWQSVLQAEDPSFLQHRGFLADAFRESIVKNYKEHRFARGGSTISMQLVKNVFLSRDKTISRKAEEALIVYLIENLGLVPKERMLEVYLNVIEWGPNVYGIGEAAKFYFNKRPPDLTIQESLFLASIIPRPKAFLYQFDHEGNLRTSMLSYFRILTDRMVWRGVLNPSDTIGLQPVVKLRGAARQVVLPNDSIPDVEDGLD